MSWLQIVQEAEGKNGKSGNVIIATLAAAMQSMNMVGAIQALAKELGSQDDRPE